MPFVSQAQQRFAFATGQPWAKRWARETTFARLPKRVRRRRKSFDVADLEAAVAAALPQPVVDAIAAQCDALPTLKAESLGPGVSRIRGDLCNVHGRYGSCSAAGFGSAPTPKKPGPVKTPTFVKPRKPLTPPKPKKGGGGKGAKPKKAGGGRGKDPAVAARQAAAAAKRQQREQEQARKRAEREAAAKRRALDKLQHGGKIESVKPSPEERAAVRAAEQAKRQAERQAAAKKRDQERTRASRAREQERQQRQAERDQARANRPAQRAAEQDARARATATRVGLGDTAVDDLRTAAESGGVTNARLSDLGLLDKDGFTSDQGRRALAALERGNVREYQAALQDARARLARERTRSEPPVNTTPRGRIVYPNRRRKAMHTTVKAGSPGDYLVVEDPAKPTTWHLQVRRNGKPDHGLMGAAWAALHAGFRGNVYQGPNKAQALSKLRALYASEKVPLPSEKAAGSFSVFKDAAGRWRWVAISSTAFRDRDGEIVSTKALADDVARADATGQYAPLRAYGPLLWWHVPTLNLGMCDFNALDGRVLIESGTFATEAIAQKVAAVAADLEVSIGFAHPPSDPDGDGVFHTIRRFERSLTPRGKASNLFTSFAVKEFPMLDDVKRAALKALGFDDDTIAGIERQSATAQKAADEAGVAYKADDPAVSEAAEPPALEEITIGGVTYTLAVKAPPPDMGMMADAEAPAEDMAEGGMEEPGEDAGGLTLSPEDLAACKQMCYEACMEACQAALGPLVGAMDLTNKMGAHMADLKTMMEGYTAKKDSEAAEQRAQVDALAATVNAQGAQLTELAGLAPAAVANRPSQSATTRVAADDPLVVNATKEADPAFPFSDLMVNLFGQVG